MLINFIIIAVNNYGINKKLGKFKKLKNVIKKNLKLCEYDKEKIDYH